MISASHNNKGFTLIEVLIAMAILVFISFGIYQATIETYKLREVLSMEGNFYNSIRLAMSVVQRDIALIYSPTVLIGLRKPDPNMPIPSNQGPPPEIANLQNQPGEDLTLPFQYWSAAIDKTGLRPSRMIGTDQKLSFISLSYSRIYKDTIGSDFAKISYELRKDDKNAEVKGTSVLVKTESPNAFTRDDLKDTFIHNYELLHGVKKMTFSYYFREGNTWKIVKSWDSDQDQPRYFFPDFIEIELEVVGPKNLSFEGKFKFRPEIPINGIPASI